jgi:hypothetical protein
VARRVPALILLGLALVFCVALAASEALTNRTGRTAATVTVTFSEQVRITSYDETVFPTKEPSSRSDTFRFSGGQLENGARFSVSWTPSTAEITSTEWETSGAATGSSSTSAPLTYEEIMAQIAHYPGADEPLYMPAENEQIWLTDLEGHADIYDNDSIKINYAPSFDKSQITRIDAYRNGVKMRFVPALFDVLTNEQMKTFDGNPAERTPKSSHTDHAIFGYEYRVQLVSGSRQFGTLAIAVENPVQFAGEVLGMVDHPFWRWLEYAPDPAGVLKTLKSRGFTGIQVTVNTFSPSPSSSDMLELYELDVALTGADWKRTATEAELRQFLGLIDQAGLSAELHLQLWFTVASYGGSTAGSLDPSNADAWFANYGDMCLRYARLATETGVDILALGVELNSMQQYPEKWCQLVGRVREAFAGRISFGEGTTHRLLWPDETFTDLWWNKKESGRFWDCFDMVGMNCWQPKIAADKDPRFSRMVEAFIAQWMETIAYYQAAYPGKSLWFSEMGARDYDGGARAALDNGPIDPSQTEQYDDQEFSDVWATFALGSVFFNLDAFTVWTVETNRPFPAQWSVMGTPALRTLESFRNLD